LLGLALVFNLNVWLSSLVDDFEGEVFDVCLHLSIIKFPSNQTLRIQDTIQNSIQGLIKKN
jgi:hypothetical protein